MSHLEINDSLSIPIREFKFSYSRSPGPGGQNVNKVNTKVTLRWNISTTPSLPDPVRQRLREQNARRINNDGELILTSHRYRDQGRNIADVLNKLRELVQEAAKRPTPRKKTKPTRSSQRRRIENKRRLSEKKQSRRSSRNPE